MNDFSVQQTLAEFYHRNDFDLDGGISKQVSWVKIGPIPLPIINLKSRKKALLFHDIHHILTGYDTSLKGEAEISAWEIAAGGWGRLWYVWMIVLSGFAMGVVFFPGATRRAFEAGKRHKNAYVCGFTHPQILTMKMQALQAEIEKGGTEQRGYRFWAILSVSIFFVAPLILALGLISAIF